MKAVTVQPDLFQGSPLRETTSLRNDREIMSYPFFTLGKNPVHEARESRWVEDDGKEVYIRLSPGEDGLPTTWDLDTLIYVQTVYITAINRGEPVSNRIQFQISDCLKTIRRGNGGRDYDNFLQSVKRLKGTTVYTNVTSSDEVVDTGFGWIQSFKIVRRKSTKSGVDEMAACEIVLCDWLYNAIIKGERLLQFDAEYFELDSGLHRKMYQIIRRHIGQSSAWHVGIDKLQMKTGSTTERRKFIYDIKEMIAKDPFPLWSLHLSTDPRGPAFGGTVVPPKAGGRAPMYLYVFRRSLRLVGS